CPDVPDCLTVVGAGWHFATKRKLTRRCHLTVTLTEPVHHKTKKATGIETIYSSSSSSSILRNCALVSLPTSRWQRHSALMVIQRSLTKPAV
ncbi:hypothetical protein M514_10329, partial [Trichuris suis]